MIYNIFRQKRRTVDWFLLLLCIPAIWLIVELQGYRQISSVPDGFHKNVQLRIDSIVQARAYTPDSILVTRMVSVDHALITSLCSELGVHNARRYLDSTDGQEFLYRLIFRKSDPRGFSVNFSGAGTTARDTESSEENRLLLIAWSNGYGQIVAEQEIRSTSNPDLDSTALFRALLDRVPKQYIYKVGHWQRETTQHDTLRYCALLSEERYHVRELQIQAVQRTNSSRELKWAVVNRVKLEYQHPAVTNGAGSMRLILAFTIAAVLIGFIIVCIRRLLKKAVSLYLCFGIAILVTVYFVLSATSVLNTNFIVVLILAFVYFIFAGFLLAGLPAAGLFSLARETFAEKFYTCLRLLYKPWQSHYTGRSILAGMSVAVFAGVTFPLLYYIADQTGNDYMFRDVVFNGEIQILLAFRPSALAASMFFTPLVIICSLLICPVLAYRWMPRGLRFVSALLGAVLFSIVFGTMQSNSLAFITVHGIISGVLGFLLFYYYDILALIVYGLFSVAIHFMPVFEAYNGIAIIFCLLGTGVLLLGFRAWASRPEIVSEEDYKPGFMYSLEEEKRMKQELEAAKSVHQRLLPARLPYFPRVNIAASCIPAFEVGGDYYDVFQLDNHRLGVLIGDVSGKGMSAAFYITLAKGVIVSQVRQKGTPAEILHRVNALLYGVMERGKFISMIYGIFDISSNQLAFANAGHNPLIIRRAESGRANIVPSRGMAIGLDSGPHFEKAVQNYNLQLYKNDTVLFYTDGVTEAMNGNVEEYGEERLLHCVGQSPATSAALVTDIMNSVNTFVGKARQHDDITVVALQSLADSESTSNFTLQQ